MSLIKRVAVYPFIPCLALDGQIGHIFMVSASVESLFQTPIPTIFPSFSSKTASSSSQASTKKSKTSSSETDHAATLSCVLWRPDPPVYTFLLMPQFKNRNPHADEVTIPGIESRKDLLSYLVPIHLTPSR